MKGRIDGLMQNKGSLLVLVSFSGIAYLISEMLSRSVCGCDVNQHRLPMNIAQRVGAMLVQLVGSGK